MALGRRTVPHGGFCLAQVAQALNTTAEHAICPLSRHPVDRSSPRFRGTQNTVTRIGQRCIWFERDHLSLRTVGL